MIVPRLRNGTTPSTETRFPLTLALNAGEYSQKAASLLAYFLPQCTVTSGSPPQIEATQANLPPESYEIDVRDGKAKIRYADYAGLRNALSTFSLSARWEGEFLILPEFTAADAPACQYRGFLLDPARGNPPFEDFCNVLIFAAKCKYNFFHFHLAECLWLSVEMDCLPKEYRYESCYTKDQVRQINELCDILGLEIIPEFDMPAHATKLIQFFPHLACTPPENSPESDWAICTGTEETYKLYEKVLDEVLDLFPNGRYFHMGGDELEFADIAHKRPNSICHWTVCSKCKEFRKKHGLRDRTEQYYYFVNYINRLVRARGRTMMMWSDQIDCARPVGIDRNILMQFWRVAVPGRGPYDGCSFNEQLNMGYSVVNSFYSDTYIYNDAYMNDEKIRSWRWDERPVCSEENRKQILGGEICAWNYGDKDPKFSYLERTIPTSFALMGDKLWNGDELPYGTEYDLALNRTVFGTGTPEGLNIFPGMGARIPPRSEECTYPDRVTCTNEEIETILETLEKGNYYKGDAFRAKIYRKCLLYTLKNRKETDEQ